MLSSPSIQIHEMPFNMYVLYPDEIRFLLRPPPPTFLIDVIKFTVFFLEGFPYGKEFSVKKTLPQQGLQKRKSNFSKVKICKWSLHTELQIYLGQVKRQIIKGCPQLINYFSIN